MEIFQQILKKAQQEGKVDPRLIPWEKPKVASRKSPGIAIQKLQLPPQLLAFPESVIHDLQKIMENIRLTSETRSL